MAAIPSYRLSPVRTALLAGCSVIGLVLAAPAAAQGAPISSVTLPIGAEVVSGQVSVSAANAAMVVDQASDKAILNWQSFDIGADASVTFRQPGSTSVALNRVLNGAGTTIAGRLSGNGRVYVANAAGVLFTGTAQVDTAGLVAVAGTIGNDDFLAGRDAFDLTGTVTNEGAIRLAGGGTAALLGQSVANAGSITANAGNVVLAAGSALTLAAGADGHLRVEVDANTANALVSNGGLIAANGGQVLLSAQGASQAFASVVSSTGTIEARTLANQGGRILLLADMAGGTVAAAGRLDASAPDGGDGGFIETSAANVGLADSLAITTAAPFGLTGQFLLDPTNITIGASASTGVQVDVSASPWVVAPSTSGANINATTLQAYLSSSNVVVSTAGSTGSEAGSITMTAPVSWNAQTTLTLRTADSGGILLLPVIGHGLVLEAGMLGVVQSGALNVSQLRVSTRANGSVTLNNAANQIGSLLGADVAAMLSLSSASALTVAGPVNGDLSVAINAAGPLAVNVPITSASGSVDLSSLATIEVNAPVTSGRTNMALNISALGSVALNSSLNAASGLYNITSAFSQILVNRPYADTRDGVSYTFSATGGGTIFNSDVTLTGPNAALAITGDYTLNGARIDLSGANASLTIDNTPYTLIRTAEDLQAITQSGNFALAEDIDASATADWNSGAGFAPIGGLGASFGGSFTGLGHFIDGLTINRPSQSQVGLFSEATSAQIRDVTLSNVSITGTARTGALVGAAYNSSFGGIRVTGSVSSLIETGGIVGWLIDSILVRSTSSASVRSVIQAAGGLVGRSIWDSYITDSYAGGPVYAPAHAGGLIGEVQAGGNVRLGWVYAAGEVTGSTDIGGLVGFLDNSGIVTATNAYWDFAATGQSTSAGSAGTGISNAFAAASYAGFDFTNTWVNIPGETRPMLRNEASSVIATPHALQLMALGRYTDYRLALDIDLAATATGGDVWGSAGFVPVGTSATPFAGSLDGAGHTIHDLSIMRPATNYVGLIGYSHNATISNIALAGGSVTGNDGVGALTGYMVGGTISNATTSVDVVGQSTGETNAGGLVGTVDGGALSYAAATGAVSGQGYQIGGLVGFLVNGGSIHRSYATGDVRGFNTSSGFGYVGGLVGGNGYTGDGGSISQSYALGSVVAQSGPAGGLVGHNEGSITDSYAMGNVTGAGNVGGLVGVNFVNGTISNSYAFSTVSDGSGATPGLIVGYNNGTSAALTDVYFDRAVDLLGVAVGGGTTGGAELSRVGNGAELPVGFSSAVWGTGNLLYPYFTWQYPVAPQAVSGGAYVGNGVISLIANGAFIGTTYSKGNGDFYRLFDAGTIPVSGVVAYSDPASGFSFSDLVGSNGVDNMRIFPNAAQINTLEGSLSATLANITTALGALNPVFSQVAINGGDLSITGTTSLRISSLQAYVLDGSLSAGRSLMLVGSNQLAVSGNRSLTAGGQMYFGKRLAWSDTSSLTLNSGATPGYSASLTYGINAPNGTLTINAGGGVVASVAVDVGTFILNSGDWSHGALQQMPSFHADDFRINPATASFLRATAGDGTAGAPYVLTDIYGLQGMASNAFLTSSFSLANNIAASGTASWNNGQGFLPIGDATNFSGALAGNGYSINGLFINRASGRGIGLFGTLSGTISDVLMSGGSVTGVGNPGYGVGALAGVVTGSGFITGSIAAVDVTGTIYPTGGLVGLMTGGSITQSAASGSIIGETTVGGLVGRINSGTVTDSHATGSVASRTDLLGIAGGFVGLMSGGQVRRSFATGATSATEYGLIFGSGHVAGGFIGRNWGGTISESFATGNTVSHSALSSYAGGFGGELNGGSIFNSYATGSAVADRAAGGFVGLLSGSTVTHAYSSGTASGGFAGNAGGFAGSRTFGTVHSAFWNTTSSLMGAATGTGSVSGITGLNTAQMQAMGSFTGWNIADQGGSQSTWRIYDGNTAPLLRAFMTPLTVTGGSVRRDYTGLAYSDAGLLSFSQMADPAQVLGTAAYTSNPGVGTYSGNALTLAGLYSTQMGYDLTLAPGSLTIDPVGLTVTLGDVRRAYDGADWRGSASVSYEGFVGQDNPTDLRGSLVWGGTAQGARDAGTYAIEASGLLSDNYIISYRAGALTVDPVPLNVVVNADSRDYNGLAYSGGNGVRYDGFVGTDGESDLGGAIVWSGTAQGARDAGTYALGASGLTSINYTISFTPSTLQIDRAPLVITADSLTSKTLKPLPPMTYRVSGLVAGDAAGAIVTGSLATNASTMVPGIYAITQGTVAVTGANYRLASFNQGQLTMQLGIPPGLWDGGVVRLIEDVPQHPADPDAKLGIEPEPVG